MFLLSNADVGTIPDKIGVLEARAELVCVSTVEGIEVTALWLGYAVDKFDSVVDLVVMFPGVVCKLREKCRFVVEDVVVVIAAELTTNEALDIADLMTFDGKLVVNLEISRVVSSEPFTEVIVVSVIYKLDSAIDEVASTDLTIELAESLKVFDAEVLLDCEIRDGSIVESRLVIRSRLDDVETFSDEPSSAEVSE